MLITYTIMNAKRIIRKIFLIKSLKFLFLRKKNNEKINAINIAPLDKESIIDIKIVEIFINFEIFLVEVLANQFRKT